jgi:hypothetical protein
LHDRRAALIRLRIHDPRPPDAQRRRKERADYTLTVGITGHARTTDAKVPGTPYHAGQERYEIPDAVISGG